MKNLVLVIFFAVVAVFYASGQSEREFYLWNTSAVNVGLSEKMNLKVSTKTHYLVTNEMRDMSYVDLSVSRKMNSWMKLGVAFRGAQLVSSVEKVMEYRPQSFVNFSLEKNGIKYHSTNRLEYRFFNSQDGHFRYYHNLFVDFPALFGVVPKTYVGEEVFTKLNSVGMHLGRIYGGMHIWENNWFGLDMYYAWQKLKRDDWITADILGLNMTFSI
ncbi:DUF2490 domain-containing protein [Sunxiuqinia sp. A32]|uniref:DUF2490 domain-containing protein n=1 Tax=Sunxiuqinia sp. A32 TaxID=3461496 RepID=UPI00404580F9